MSSTICGTRCALDLIHEHVAKDVLLFQSMQRGSRRIADVAVDYEITAPAPFDQPGFPRMHFVERRYSNDPTNWWIPNRACMEAMLRASGFALEAQPRRRNLRMPLQPLAEAPDGPHCVYPIVGTR